ncbi:MAG: sel1 repeat family protein [Enhydrobacter sp.]|nr:MAG: sel1 repeat family protein [Enhydrobacter sp.]
MRLLTSLLLVFLCTASPVSAGPYEDGTAAYSRSDYATAMRLLRPLADQGNGGAQIYVGMMHELGQGVSKNGAVAAEWYRKAADKGWASAQGNLGALYAQGLGVPRDYVQAYKWWTLAAARFQASQRERRDITLKSRNEIAAKMTQAQIAEAERQAKEWKPR